MSHRASIAAFLIAGLFSTSVVAAPILVDDFEDGTTENWFAGGGPFGATPPVPPTNIPTGGPAGADDNFLLVTAIGGGGPGSRLVVMNGTQWAMNYIANGIIRIEMDVFNFGQTALFLRLLFEDPLFGPPTNIALSDDPIVLAPGGGWVHVAFPVTPDDLVALAGSVEAALSQTTLLRLFHSTTETFPGEPIVGSVGVDNITAVPEPSTLLLLFTAIAVTRARRRR